jgi:hypothetical protein
MKIYNKRYMKGKNKEKLSIFVIDLNSHNSMKE